MQLDKIVEDLKEISTKKDYLKYCLNNAIEDRDMTQIIRYYKLIGDATKIQVNLSVMLDEKALKAQLN